MRGVSKPAPVGGRDGSGSARPVRGRARGDPARLGLGVYSPRWPC